MQLLSETPSLESLCCVRQVELAFWLVNTHIRLLSRVCTKTVLFSYYTQYLKLRPVGLHIEAVTVLQDSGLWQCSATLAAQALPRSQQAAALERWASHIHQVSSFPRTY